MKRTLIILLTVVVLCTPSVVLAHKPLLTVEDNGDGTIYVETGFSDGSSGAGHKIILKNKDSGDVLSEQTIPEEGYIEEIPMPNVPYTVTFDAGPGHVAVKDGPFSEDAAASAASTESVADEEATDISKKQEDDTSAAPVPPQPAPIQEAPAPLQSAPPIQEVATKPVQPVQQPVVVPSSGVTMPQQYAPVQMPMMAAATTSPGVEMAMKMAVTSQMITALAVLVVLGAIMFLIGYMIGKDAGKTRA